MSGSVIYRNIFFYRLAMQLLYGFRYKKRFRVIWKYVKGRSVTECCFGDLHIARMCRKNGIEWTGYDSNPGFTERAKKKGYHAHEEDVASEHPFKKSDTCIMAGSLYHFLPDAKQVIHKMLECAPRVIISEPVKNIASLKGPLGSFAASLSGTQTGKKNMRFNRQTLMKLLRETGDNAGAKILVAESFKKDSIVILEK